MQELTKDEIRLFMRSPIYEDLRKLRIQLERNRGWEGWNEWIFYGTNAVYFSCLHMRIAVVNKKKTHHYLSIACHHWWDEGFNISQWPCDLYLDQNKLIELHETIKFLIEETQREYEKYQGGLDIFKQSLDIAKELML